jgi:FixJ family two-component response regulator
MGGDNGAKKIGRHRSRSESYREAEGGSRTPAPGDTTKVIARGLGMREGTVKVHVRQIMRKFGLTNRTQVAVVCALI